MKRGAGRKGGGGVENKKKSEMGFSGGSKVRRLASEEMVHRNQKHLSCDLKKIGYTGQEGRKSEGVTSTGDKEQASRKEGAVSGHSSKDQKRKLTDQAGVWRKKSVESVWDQNGGGH